MRTSTRLTAAVLAILAGHLARADTVDVTSTTLLRVGQETRGGQPGGEPNLDTVAPAFEILSIAARGVTNPLVDDLAIVVSTWGSYDLADRRWDNGTGSSLTGDVMTGYVQGRLLDRHLALRVGRAHVMTGAARMIHLDGGEAIGYLPGGLRLSAHGGVPVSQRFTTRQAIRNWNPVGGDLAYGGRLAWARGLAGSPGRGVDVGASVSFVEDGGDPVREEAAADFRVQPIGALVVSGLAAYSLYDERVSELSARAAWSVTRRLRLEADGRFVAPDLLLARNSILSVFSDEERISAGGGAAYDFGKGFSLSGAYHALVEPGETEAAGDELGHELEVRVDFQRGPTLAGGELLFLDALENGYLALRLFGRRELGRFFAAADVFAHVFREQVNGEDLAITGTLTGGVNLARGFTAVVAGRAGMTPFLEQTFDVMAKLAYNSTYRIREVR